MKSITKVQPTTVNRPKSGLDLIYTLDVLDWSMCIGGRHYTGHVCWQEIDSAGITQYNRHELERRLSLSEAKELSETDGRLWLLHERITNRFDTRSSIERAAIKWVEKNAKETDWLLQYNSQLNPEKTLAARGYFVDRRPELDKLAEIWDRTPNSVRENVDVYRSVYGLYHKLISQ